MKFVLLPCVCFAAILTVAQAGPVRRLILHDDQSVTEKIHGLEATVALLNSTVNTLTASMAKLSASLNQAVAELRNDIQAESKERCQVGAVSFGELQCHPTHSGYFSCHQDRAITFNPHFTKPPHVTYALKTLDVDANQNLRADSSSSHVTTSGATLTVTTWANSHLFGVQLSWIACPSL